MIAAVNSWTKGARYCEQAAAGEIVVPETITGVCRRHLDDLANQGGLYYFDEDEAVLAIDKIEHLLCHSIGIHAGQPFILEPWQAFGIGCLFGWRKVADGSRRFRELYWSTGRKNGKSTIAAALAILVGALDSAPSGGIEQISEVVLAATKKDQATKIIFAEVCRMRNQSPEIKDISTELVGQIKFHHNGGTIHCVGSDKSFDGLNPSACYLDEVHAMTEQHRNFYNTMTTGSGARAQPINGVFTTAGDDRSFLWLEIYNFNRAIAVGTATADHVLPIIYEIDPDDDPLNPDVWIKANPNLGVSLRLEYLDQQAAKAATTPQELAVFQRYHANRLVTSTAKAFDMVAWQECTGGLSDWAAEADAIGAACDIGGRDDLASLAMVARFDSGMTDDDGQPIWRYEGRQQSYIASDTQRDLTQQPFESFVREGQLIVCKFPITQMKTDLLAWLNSLPIDSVSYDPAGGQQFAEQIEAEGFPIASMAQSYRHFHEPITTLQSVIADGRFRHSGDPLLTFALGNAVTIQNRQCQLMYSKRDSASKIDPIVALTMAFRRCTSAKPKCSGPLFLQ